jgi:hypothetical protein
LSRPDYFVKLFETLTRGLFRGSRSPTYMLHFSFSIYHTICDGGDANRQFIKIHFNSCHPSELHFIGYNIWTPEVLMIFMMDCKVRVSVTNMKHCDSNFYLLLADCVGLYLSIYQTVYVYITF